MTVWDKDALEAPHTLRELALDGEPAPGSTTKPENATCPSAGGFGGRHEHRLIAAAREALEIVKAGNLREMTLDEAWAQRLSNLKPMATDEAIAHALRNDAGWMAWQEVQRLRAENANLLIMLIECNAAAGKEVMPDDEAANPADARYATSPGVKAGAVLSAIAAEKAEWPHAGSMHDGARHACDNIATLD